MNVFTYGSLMYAGVWLRVVTGTYAQQKGVVRGFQRLRVNNEHYPGLIKGEGDVAGVVYIDVSAGDMARLDQFEGELYRRELVEVVVEDESRIQAFVYVIRDEFKGILGDTWSVEEFERQGLAEFVARYSGFERM